jgi:hypothetical protein
MYISPLSIFSKRTKWTATTVDPSDPEIKVLVTKKSIFEKRLAFLRNEGFIDSTGELVPNIKEISEKKTQKAFTLLFSLLSIVTDSRLERGNIASKLKTATGDTKTILEERDRKLKQNIDEFKPLYTELINQFPHELRVVDFFLLLEAHVKNNYKLEEEGIDKSKFWNDFADTMKKGEEWRENQTEAEQGWREKYNEFKKSLGLDTLDAEAKERFKWMDDGFKSIIKETIEKVKDPTELENKPRDIFFTFSNWTYYDFANEERNRSIEFALYPIGNPNRKTELRDREGGKSWKTKDKEYVEGLLTGAKAIKIFFNGPAESDVFEHTIISLKEKEGGCLLKFDNLFTSGKYGDTFSPLASVILKNETLLVGYMCFDDLEVEAKKPLIVTPPHTIEVERSEWGAESKELGEDKEENDRLRKKWIEVGFTPKLVRNWTSSFISTTTDGELDEWTIKNSIDAPFEIHYFEWLHVKKSIALDETKENLKTVVHNINYRKEFLINLIESRFDQWNTYLSVEKFKDLFNKIGKDNKHWEGSPDWKDAINKIEGWKGGVNFKDRERAVFTCFWETFAVVWYYQLNKITNEVILNTDVEKKTIIDFINSCYSFFDHLLAKDYTLKSAFVKNVWDILKDDTDSKTPFDGEKSLERNIKDFTKK